MGQTASIIEKFSKATLGIVMALALALPQAGIAWAVEGDGASGTTGEVQAQSEDQLQGQSENRETAQLEAQSAGVAAPLEAQATQDLQRKVLPESEPSLLPSDKLTGKNWMAGVSGALYLHEINIPGTHDSCMWDPYAPRSIAKTMGSYAKTQSYDINQQLLAGTRFFDIRLTNVYRPGVAPFIGKADDRKLGEQGLYPVHGAYKGWQGDWRFYGDQSKGVLTFDTVMNWYAVFLQANPTETLILDITFESDSGDHDVAMARAREKLDAYYNKVNPATGKPFIYTQNGSKTITTMPTLAETRGQIVLMSSSNDLKLGMPYKWTGDWGGRDIAGVHFAVENHYEVTRDDKVKALKALLTGGSFNGAKFTDPEGGARQNVPTTVSDSPTTRSALISTGSNRPPVVTSKPHQTPKEVSETVNASAFQVGSNMLAESGKLTGWVYSDFVTNDTASTFWKTNFPDSLKRCTITYKATVNGTELTEAKVVESGSKIKLPANPFGKDASGKSKLGTAAVGTWQISNGSTVRSFDVGEEVTVNNDITYTANTDLTWSGLQDLINKASPSGTTIELSKNLTANVVDKPLTIPSGIDITINMNGHTLDKAGHTDASGSVFQVYGTLRLNGGANGATVKGGYAKSGGGVWVASSSQFIATNVAFSGNTATASGGGVFMSPNSTVSLNGCTVTNNKAGAGGGAYVAAGATFKVKGNMKIENNTTGNVQLARYVSASGPLRVGSVITIDGSLDGSSIIGVSTETTPTTASPVTVSSGLSGKGGAGNFKSDKVGFEVVEESTEAALRATAVTHTVSFESNGGTAVTAQTVNHGAKATIPTQPTKADSIFAGWYSDAEFAKPYSFDAPVTADLKLYAKWAAKTAEKHTVAFDTLGGMPDPKTQVVEANGKATRPTDPTLKGYTFGGWYTDTACTVSYNFDLPVTDDLTLYAKWTGASYVVEFVTDGGTEVDDQVVGGGGTATKPADPKKDGYAFSGWYTVSGDQASAFDFATPINADTVLYAHWTADKTPSHTVTFDANGGSPTPAAQTVEDGNTASEPSTAPTWDNGTFAGWYEQIELTDEEIAQIESDPSMSDIVWIDNGKAYVEYDFNDPVFEDTMLRAHWTQERYEVTYIDQGDVVEVLEVNKGDKAPELAFDQVDGFSFNGWFTDEALTAKYDFSTPVTGNLTLYSDWAPRMCTVTFNSEGGSAVAAQSVAYEGMATVPANPEKAGSTFMGWYIDLGFEATEEDIAQMVPVEEGYGFEFTDLLWNTNGTTMLKYDLASEPVYEDIDLHARWSEGVVTTDVVIGQGAPAVEVSNLDEAARALLTDDEIKAGAHVWFQVTALAEADVPSADKAPLDAYVRQQGAAHGAWFDISVYKSIGGGEAVAVHELPVPARLSITIPDSLRSGARTFHLLRAHDGEVASIASTEGTTLEGASDRFSTYEIAYTKSVAATRAGKTGDYPWLMLFAGIAVAALGTTAFAFAKRRRADASFRPKHGK